MIKRVIHNLLLTYRNTKINKSLKNSGNVKLTKHEKALINNYWGKEMLCRNSYICYEFYKHFRIFDHKLIANNIYAEAERLLNPFRYSLFLQHKCYLRLFIPQEHRPKTIIQNIDNHYLDSEGCIISKDEAIAIARNHSSFFIKVAAGSGGGRGIMKLDTHKDNIEKIFDEYNKDFICQEPLEEHETLSRFNKKCINTIRVLSLNINDNCTILSSFIRMGGIGSIVDNLHSSEGSSALVGINSNGDLHSFGIDKDYNKVFKAPSGLSFEGLNLEHYQKIVEFVKFWHKKSFPSANLIGWDIIIDKNNNPIVIEINLDSADIAAHQIFNGPIFADRTEEVIQYMKDNQNKLILKL